jgi:hypothetical protein
MRMRILCPPTWRMSINLATWARKLKIPLAGLQPVSAIIIVGNGIPDDVVWLILGHKFDGEHVVGITKPREELGINSLSSIPKLIESGRTESLIVSMDQERLTLEEVEANIKRKLRETGVEHELIEEGRRIYVFNCVYACHRFRTAIVVNGLDKPYRRHTIEDHLLEFYREFVKRDLESLLSDVSGDPKEAWRRLKSEEELIYNQLLRVSCDELERTFTQHVRALKLLMS